MFKEKRYEVICNDRNKRLRQSTYAIKLAKEYNATIVSTDSIRQELFGSEDNQTNNKLVFTTAFNRIKTLLNNKQNVIFDATNVTNKSRINLKKQLALMWKNIETIAVIINTPFEIAVKQNNLRNRKVPYNVIEKQYKNLINGYDRIKELYSNVIIINKI